MILIIDNYDSFTYNLVQYLRQMGREVIVKRNDETTIEEIEKLSPSVIVISPGPSNPDNAGISLEVVKKLHMKYPILGICLGHQTIAQAFGCRIIRAKKIMHGKTSTIKCDGEGIFKGAGEQFQAMRYHSLAVDRNTVGDELIITAHADDDEIMGIRHREYPVEGIQFHPESIMTSVGKRLLRNFLKLNAPD